MKTLRDDVRQRIIDAATEEFLLSGYARASMRAIAAQAGMTVGNIYLYFAGKEQLFDAVVHLPVEQLRRMLRITTPTDETLRALVDSLRDIFIQNRVEFLILITRSEGSKYEAFKQSIVDMAINRIVELLPDSEDARIAGPISTGLIEGLLALFNGYEGDEARLTGDLFRFLHYMLRDLFPAAKAKEEQ